MSAAAFIARKLRRRFIAQECLLLERQAPYKSALYDGEIFAMAGASREHALITLNIAAELRTPLRHSRCEMYARDTRVAASVGYYDPDLVAVCENGNSPTARKTR